MRITLIKRIVLTKIVAGLMLALFLASTLTITFKIQPVKADLKTSEVEKSFSVDGTQFKHNATSHNEKGNKEQARIVEHRITTLELEKLKREIGVWEEDRKHTQIINGHGTGLRPPTEEEWAKLVNKIYVVERILLNQTIQPPSSVDHTTKPWFPPIGNQGGEGSCVTWAVGYYMKTFQEAKEHEWNLSKAEWVGGHPTPSYQDQIFSPDFIYHLINGGIDQGSSFYDAINLVCTIGASSWEKMPYDPGNHTSWPSEEAWREAPLYRGNSSGYETLEFSMDGNLTSLKNWIASDHLAVIGVDAGQYSNLTSGDVWTLDSYKNLDINHANTIVGYDDNIEYTEGGELRYGAFKIANSWGEGGWENIPDGCYWISYGAMKQRVGYCMFYRDKIDYMPELVSSFRINHSKRDECDVLIGMGNHTSPTATKSFSDLIDGGDFPFCSNNIVFDITEFEEAIPTVINQSFFMEVYDGGPPPPHSGIHEWYSDRSSYSLFRLNRTFDIPETGATLRFWSFYEIEEDWDYGYVEAHDLDTGEWYTLPGLMTVSTLPYPQDNPNCPDEFEPTAYYDAGRWHAFTGFSGGWYQEEMDLTLFAGHTIELYFTHWTDQYVLELGWYIDDIEIPEIGFFDDVESGPNGWTYNGWYITTVSSSTTGTILSFSIEYYYNYSSGTLYAKSTSRDVPVNTTNQGYVFAELMLTNIWTVDDDGPADFHTIQEAINAANPEDTLFVFSGKYYEHVILNKTVTLIGENISSTIVDGNGTGNVINITANNVNMAGFTIQNGTYPNCGIYVSSSGNNISCNTITNNEYGIWLEYSSNNKFYHNNFINNTQQVHIHKLDHANFWDDGHPSGGNYWSDYNGTDLLGGPYQNETGSDGIGDTPYTIDENNTDDYPLMSPWGSIFKFTHPETISTYQVHLEVNTYFSKGYYLLAEFHTYSDVYQGSVTVWSGTTPSDVVLSIDVSHPQSKGIEKVYLVLKYINMTKIQTITSFTMKKPDLFKRLVYFDGEWGYVSPEERSAMMNEITDMDIQWTYAP